MSTARSTMLTKQQFLQSQFCSVPQILDGKPVLNEAVKVAPGIDLVIREGLIIELQYHHSYLLPDTGTVSTFIGVLLVTVIGVVRLLAACGVDKLEALMPHVLFRLHLHTELCYPYETPQHPDVKDEAIQRVLWAQWNVKAEDHPLEEWRDIADAIGFQVSNYGRVRSKHEPKKKLAQRIKRKVHLAPFPAAYNPVVTLITQERITHMLVVAAFKPTNSRHKVVHLDGITINNSADNLEWVETLGGPAKSAATSGKRGKKPSYQHHLLNVAKVGEIFSALNAGADVQSLAVQHGVRPSEIEEIKTGITWAYYTGVTPLLKGKLTQADKDNIQLQFKSNESAASLAKRYGVSATAISKVVVRD